MVTEDMMDGFMPARNNKRRNDLAVIVGLFAASGAVAGLAIIGVVYVIGKVLRMLP